jgi:hypothetical protein
MMLLLDNVEDTRWGKRREQELTIGESRPRLPVWVKQFYPQMRARSNQGLFAKRGDNAQACV